MMIFKNTYIAILITMLLAISVVIVLTLSSLESINYKNNFARRILKYNLQLITAAETKNEIVAIAGYTNHRIYFQTSASDKIYSTDWSLKAPHYFILNLPTNDLINTRFNCLVDSPTVYL